MCLCRKRRNSRCDKTIDPNVGLQFTNSSESESTETESTEHLAILSWSYQTDTLCDIMTPDIAGMFDAPCMMPLASTQQSCPVQVIAPFGVQTSGKLVCPVLASAPVVPSMSLEFLEHGLDSQRPVDSNSVHELQQSDYVLWSSTNRSVSIIDAEDKQQEGPQNTTTQHSLFDSDAASDVANADTLSDVDAETNQPLHSTLSQLIKNDSDSPQAGSNDSNSWKYLTRKLSRVSVE